MFLLGKIFIIFLYLLIEIVIFIVESIVYSIALKKINDPPVGVFKAILYAFIANLATFLTGISVR